MSLVRHALGEIWSKPPLFVCAAVSLAVLAAFVILLFFLAFRARGEEASRRIND